MDVAREEVTVRAQVENNGSAGIRTKRAFRFASVIALITVAATVLDGHPAVAAETPKAPSAKAVATAVPAKPAPISLEDYFAGVSKPGTSAGDQASFAKKHAGASVTWTGYVRAVNKNLSPDGTIYKLILKSKPTDEAPLGLFVVQLAGADEKQLLALEKDQKVTVSGTLEVTNPAIPEITDAKLSDS